MSATDITIEIAQGRVRGALQDGVASFRGIPYAQPPVGRLRFALPEPAGAWQGVRDASRRTPIAPQVPARISIAMGNFEREMSEDCLTLAIWTPTADAKRRPVIVWLHGGGFSNGAGDLAWYDGSSMAAKGDIVVVGVNYRLGALGFMRARGLTPGNLGLSDQELALHWVSDNIASFGGDPSNITLMGQSAGGLSIALLLGHDTLPPVRRAIMLSPPLGAPLLTLDRAEQIGETYVRALGIDPDANDVGDQVRRLPEAALMQAQAAATAFFFRELAKQPDTAPPFMPVAGGHYVPSIDAIPAAFTAAAARCDVLIGTTRDEAAAFFPETWEPAITAKQFELPSIRWAQDAAAAGRTAYLFRLDWASKGSSFGAAHCIDLPFVFDTVDAFAEAPMLAGASRSEMGALVAAMLPAFTTYARSGTPNHPGLPEWPACTPTQTSRLHFDRVHRILPAAASFRAEDYP
ncbi:MAG: carboxylesterase/lipase family protein [Caldimonas sp.]